MVLFECADCHCIENTALCNANTDRFKKKDLICSECDPLLGKWHEKFIKRPVTDEIRVDGSLQFIVVNGEQFKYDCGWCNKIAKCDGKEMCAMNHGKCTKEGELKWK